MEPSIPPSRPSADDITAYLHRWRGGEQGVLDELVPKVYEQLRAMARSRLRAERPDHTLDTVGLVHEAYLRLTTAGAVEWRDRSHFFAVASTAMRRVLLDHAKARAADKRGGGAIRVSVDDEHLRDAAVAADQSPETLLAINDALTRLAERHPRAARAVELRYFAGLTLEEAAQVLGTSAPTVLRDLRFAQAWLAREFA